LVISGQVCRAQLIVSEPLYCIVKDLTGGNENLTWGQAPNNPCGAFWGYKIYRSALPTGPFVLVATIPTLTTTTWADLGAASGTWYYYVVDSFSCPGATYQPSDTVRNESNPQPPVVSGVSVNADGSVTVSWLPSPSPQTKFYYIYIITPSGQTIRVGTVAAPTTVWTDYAHNPSASSIKYTVAATDSCYGNQPSAYDIHSQQTTYLTYQAARCDKAIKFNWSKYLNIPGGVRSYKVFISKNAGPYQFVDAVDSATATYSYTNFIDGDSIQVYIQTMGFGDTTVQPTSNYLRFVATVIKPPAYIYLTRLSVDTSNNAVDATWIVDTYAKMESYQILNSEDNSTFTSVGVKAVSQPTPRLTAYADSSAQPQYGVYYYQVKGIDSCQTYTTTSTGNIISLSATLSDYYQITVAWNLFHLDSATVDRYELYRGHGTGYQLIHTFDSRITTYIDTVTQFLNEPGEFCYFIKAYYHLNLPLASYTLDTTTFSNIACVDHRPIIYVPNAFVYNGVNNFFKPRIIFSDPAGYSMTIWDRYGAKIFETHDPTGSWDGTNHGQVVEQGGYAYLIQFTALDGTAVERKGIVLFIRK